MLEEKISFKWDHEKSKQAPMQLALKFMFRNEFRKEHEFSMDEELLLKVGRQGKEYNMPFKLWGLYSSYGEIYQIDDIRFLGEALTFVRQHRIIKDNLYRIVDFKECDAGECIFAYNGEPMFDINLGETNVWAYKPFTISYYKKKGFFGYVPDLEVRPGRIDLELMVENQKKEKLLVNMFKKTKKIFIENEFEVLEAVEEEEKPIIEQSSSPGHLCHSKGG